jgi:hypothetical protein
MRERGLLGLLELGDQDVCIKLRTQSLAQIRESNDLALANLTASVSALWLFQHRGAKAIKVGNSKSIHPS